VITRVTIQKSGETGVCTCSVTIAQNPSADAVLEQISPDFVLIGGVNSGDVPSPPINSD
jgi:hypothetical protein